MIKISNTFTVSLETSTKYFFLCSDHIVFHMGLIASLLMGILLEGTSMFQLRHWVKGAIRGGDVTFLGQSIHHLGPTYGISIVLKLTARVCTSV